MKKGCLNLVGAVFENMLTVNMLLMVCLPGVLAGCGNRSPGISIITPIPNEALSGSCLQVPCSFKEENSFHIHQVPSGVWIKSPKDIFITNNGVNKYPIEIIGNLNKKNCTTLFSNVSTNNEGTYFFRIETTGNKATACAVPLTVKVRDSPWRPSINIPVGDLKEHQSVTISCSALTPCPHSPPELTWNLQQDSERQTEKNPDGTFTTKIQETITLSDTHDGYNISCSARYPVNGGSKTAETEVILNVSYSPKDTSASISPSGLVSAGSWVELSCSSRAKPPASFTWFRNSTDGPIKLAEGNFSSINVTMGGQHYCVATNPLGNDTSPMACVNIKDSPWSPSINIPVGDLKEHQSFTISCSAVTPCPHSPPELTWNLQQDSERLTEKNTDGTFTTKIQETITLSDTHDGYNISCSARYPVKEGNTTAETELTLSVSYSPKDTSASISPSGLVSAGSWVELSCSSRAKPPASFTWFRNSTDGPIKLAEGNFSSINVTMGGQHYCVATNPLGNDTSPMACVNIKDSPWSPSINIPVGDLKEHQSFTISCSAVTPCPHSPPELTWNLQQDSERLTEKNTDGTFTTKIQETITLSDTHDGYNINCSARYPVKEGNTTAETELTLSVSYAPKDTSATISPSNLVSAGSWVELSCSSRAKPSISSFIWFKKSSDGDGKVAEGNPYRFKARDGEKYFCVAQNDLGNNTSLLIHLTVYGLLHGPLYWGAIPVGCIVFACLFTGLWCFKSKRVTTEESQSQTRDSHVSFSNEKEDLHYGEVNFHKKTPHTSSKHDNERQETVYAEVKVSKPENNSTVDDSPDDPGDQKKEE